MKKKILITGCLGYIATELISVLDSEKYEIVGIDSNYIDLVVKNLEKRNIIFYKQDVFDSADLISWADIIIHLSSITKVPIIQSEETEEISQNIYKNGTLATLFVLENMRADARIIFTSTHVVHNGLQETIFNIEENYPVCPLLSYPRSKAESEVDIINSGLNYTIFRLGTVYGYNPQIRFAVVNLFAKMAGLNQTIKLFGGGTNYKSLVAVQDVIRAIEMAIESNILDNNLYNLANDNITVKGIANICKKYNSNLEILETPDEVINKGYTISSQKILDTGFHFLQDLDHEIARMIEIWKNN